MIRSISSDRSLVMMTGISDFDRIDRNPSSPSFGPSGWSRMIRRGGVPVHFNSLQLDAQLVGKLWSEKYTRTLCRIFGSLLTIRIQPMSWFISSLPTGHQARFRSRQFFSRQPECSEASNPDADARL